MRAAVKRILRPFLPAFVKSAVRRLTAEPNGVVSPRSAVSPGTGLAPQRAGCEDVHPATHEPAVETGVEAAAVSASADYEVIPADHARASGYEGWDLPAVAANQHAAFKPLIQEMHAGRPRQDFVVAAEAVRHTGISSPSLLEVGCGSGYYSEVLPHLLGRPLQYFGVDASRAMIDLARRSYPAGNFEFADACVLPFGNAAFDIVMNGVSLMHIPHYEAAVGEAARVARSWCIFHTVPVLQRRATTFLRKKAYGAPTVEVIFNERELLDLFRKHGLEVCHVAESIPYDVSPWLGESSTTKTYLCRKAPAGVPGPMYVNLGCGHRYHFEWLNFDIAAHGPGVIAHDVTRGIPLPDAYCDMVYHSNMLEHLRHDEALPFLRECFRVLKPGGILRVAVPDLETICRLYLEKLEQALAGSESAARDREWMVLEMYDQTVRERSGGAMLEYLRQDPLPNEQFVLGRIGEEGRELLHALRVQPKDASGAAPPSQHLSPDQRALAIGRFRLGGEVHCWMYDRFSLAQLMMAAGFCSPLQQSPAASRCSDWAQFHLEQLPDGTVMKPDSLAMEAVKPGDALLSFRGEGEG